MRKVTQKLIIEWYNLFSGREGRTALHPSASEYAREFMRLMDDFYRSDVLHAWQEYTIAAQCWQRTVKPEN